MPITDITVKVLEMTPYTIRLEVWGQTFNVGREWLLTRDTQLDALLQDIKSKLALMEVDMNDDAQIKQVIEDTTFLSNGEFKI